jgi:hypothetical protein
MKFKKQELQPLFREKPWLIHPMGVIFLLAWPIILPWLIWRELGQELTDIVVDYFTETWKILTFTGFKVDE